jgi:hypothetical protein
MYVFGIVHEKAAPHGGVTVRDCSLSGAYERGDNRLRSW